MIYVKFWHFHSSQPQDPCTQTCCLFLHFRCCYCFTFISSFIIVKKRHYFLHHYFNFHHLNQYLVASNCNFIIINNPHRLNHRSIKHFSFYPLLFHSLLTPPIDRPLVLSKANQLSLFLYQPSMYWSSPVIAI